MKNLNVLLSIFSGFQVNFSFMEGNVLQPIDANTIPMEKSTI